MWNYLYIFKFQRCSRWRLRTDRSFHATIDWACDYHFSKRGPCSLAHLCVVKPQSVVVIEKNVSTSGSAWHPNCPFLSDVLWWWDKMTFSCDAQHCSPFHASRFKPWILVSGSMVLCLYDVVCIAATLKCSKILTAQCDILSYYLCIRQINHGHCSNVKWPPRHINALHLDCLLSSLHRLTSKEKARLRITGILWR